METEDLGKIVKLISIFLKENSSKFEQSHLQNGLCGTHDDGSSLAEKTPKEPALFK